MKLADNLASQETSRRKSCAFAAMCIATMLQAACSTGSTAVQSPTAAISVSLSPAGVNLFLGQTQSFAATVTGTSNTVVTWQVNGVTGGGAAFGQVSASGVYAAPATLPNPASATVTAVSAADSSASASLTIVLKDDIVVSVSPPTANVPAGGEQIFSASISATGNPALGVTWSVNGIAGGNATIGTIVASASGTAAYTAPAVPPLPATVTVTATSVADNSKSGSAAVTVACSATNSISPSSASVALGNSQSFSASFCLATGATIAWDVNGIAGGNSSLGTIVVIGPSAAVYSAPADLPVTNPITIHATASAVTSGSGVASASVTITSSVSVSVSPPSQTVVTAQRISLAANVSGTSDGAVSWFVNGTANGNSAAGQICIAGSNPCAAPAGPLAGSVDFLAPATVPAPNSVAITATSRADSSQGGSATIAVIAAGPVSVAISPPYIFLPPSSSQPDTQQFYVTMSGTANTGVTWTMQTASGQPCSGNSCGSITSAGLYTAPTAAPSPNAIVLTATSRADSMKSATATVVVSSGPTIETISPSSAMAGAVEGFPLAVHGVNFAAGSGSNASVILLNGIARATTCSTPGLCAIALNPSDLASAGTITIEVQNPGTPGAISNPVPFVIVPFDISIGTIPLTSNTPVAAAVDIIVTDPTTAAASSPINVQSVGPLTSGNSCGVQGSPLTVFRPASGSETVSICVYGNGLDPAFSYAFTGPASAPNASDIGVAPSAVTGLFPGMIELDLQIASGTLPGLRALIVTTINNDRAVATGILEVK